MLHNPKMAMRAGEEGQDAAPRRWNGLLRTMVRGVARGVADYALPPRCPACGVIVGDDRQFCLACWSSLDFLDGPACSRCSIPLPDAPAGIPLECGACLADPPPFDGAPAAVAYGPAARTVALRLKYGRRLGHARLMAQFLARPLAALTAGEGDGEPLLVPIPLHRWRLWSRGFNQAALVADALARHSGVAHDPHLLVRTRATASLRGRTKRERERIVGGAFALAPAARTRAAGRHLILIDDVHASGATLRAAARALRRAGAARVSALTWARVVPGAASPVDPIDFAMLDSDMDGRMMTG